MRTATTILFLLLSLPFLGQEVSHEVIIGNGNEDADEEDGFIQIYDLELDMGWDNGILSRTALYFRDVHLEPDATVSSVVLQLTTQQTFNDTVSLNIRLENNPFPAFLVDTIPLVAARTFVDQAVRWDIEPGVEGDLRQSPELINLVQPLLSSASWEVSSSLYFIIEPAGLAPDSGSMKYQCYSYDQVAIAKRPKLIFLVDSNDINGISMPTNSDFSFYPNPAFDRLNLRFTSGSTNRVMVLNAINGQRVKTWHIPVGARSHQIDLSAFDRGIYYIQDLRSGRVNQVVLQ